MDDSEEFSSVLLSPAAERYEILFFSHTDVSSTSRFLLSQMDMIYSLIQNHTLTWMHSLRVLFLHDKMAYKSQGSNSPARRVIE